MRLGDVIADIGYLECHAELDLEIQQISWDSRTVLPGSLFVAITGYQTDGHRYLKEAAARGATAVLCERPPNFDIPYFLVPSGRRALAAVSATFFGYPAREMTIIGVTGTNGKTTTTYLLKGMLEQALGAKVGLIGTNQNLIGDQILPAERTTPESYEIQHLLRRMADLACTHVVMEVSSHALALERVAGIEYSVGIFTNLTRDHLDFHKTMEGYRQAKERLFAQSSVAIFNLDDETGRYYARQHAGKKYTVSTGGERADLMAWEIGLFPDHVTFDAVTEEQAQRVRLALSGRFNVSNALGVIACGLSLGLSLKESVSALEGARGVQGRLEVVPAPDCTVLIDYAHTPDALENALKTVRDFTKGQLVVLFGCGGDRDRTKRSVMGAIAAELADFVILTSDNPRTEDPNAILFEILEGMKGCQTPFLVQANRRDAIRFALRHAGSQDVVLLAGKGHETYQVFGTEKVHFDEREEVAAFYRGNP